MKRLSNMPLMKLWGFQIFLKSNENEDTACITTEIQRSGSKKEVCMTFKN